MRPSRVLVGEVRAEECLDLLVALNSRLTGLGVNDYGDDIWQVVAVFELDDEGRIVTDTRYYTQRSDAPEWRAQWVEPID